MNSSFLKRRRLLSAALVGSATSLLPSWALGASSKVILPFAYGERDLLAFPEKKPMIVHGSRPPQLETPFGYFDNQIITPNDEFFVRYHLASIPTSIDPETYRLKVGGNVTKPLELSLHDIKTQFTSTSVVAVNQCSGNSRGLFEPRVNGGQIANGAMGNATWTGVSLQDILRASNPNLGSKQVTFNGLDAPVIPSSADFIKALDIDHAMHGEVMIAYQMNGVDIPMLNGYPLKLIVPGYYGTYWVKHLSQINVVGTVFNGYWMEHAYRIPDNDCHCMPPGEKATATIPINKLAIRSFITSPTEGSAIHVNEPTLVRGIAFDSGNGIAQVLLSQDGGESWIETELGQDLGRYSFRAWQVQFTAQHAGPVNLQVRAVSRTGETQPMLARWMSTGYMRNVVESIGMTAV